MNYFLYFPFMHLTAILEPILAADLFDLVVVVRSSELGDFSDVVIYIYIYTFC